jgi:hypothetical protein
VRVGFAPNAESKLIEPRQLARAVGEGHLRKRQSAVRTVRAVKLDRRWWVAIGVAVVAAVALVLQYTVFNGPSEECRPVKDLMDFNRAQAEQIASKGGDEQGVPTAAEDTAYQAWADGVAERAQKVTSPDLARTATTVASLANEFVGKLPLLRAQTEARAPGAPAPPVAYEMAALNARISNNLDELAKACS